MAREYGFSVNTPVKDLPKKFIDIILYGTDGVKVKVAGEFATRDGEFEMNTAFEGVIPNLERRYGETDSEYMRSEIENYMRVRKCPSCNGKRLKPEVLAVTVGERGIVEVSNMSIDQTAEFFKNLPKALSVKDQTISKQILKN